MGVLSGASCAMPRLTAVLLLCGACLPGAGASYERHASPYPGRARATRSPAPSRVACAAVCQSRLPEQCTGFSLSPLGQCLLFSCVATTADSGLSDRMEYGRAGLLTLCPTETPTAATFAAPRVADEGWSARGKGGPRG